MFKLGKTTFYAAIMVISKTVSKTTNVNVCYKPLKLTEITQKLSQINIICRAKGALIINSPQMCFTGETILNH